jgi:hypothetical protein
MYPQCSLFSKRGDLTQNPQSNLQKSPSVGDIIKSNNFYEQVKLKKHDPKLEIKRTILREGVM